MTNRSIFHVAYAEVRRPVVLIVVLLIGIVLSAAYPTKLESYPVLPAGAGVPMEVTLTENYVRFVPTAVQVALPVVLGDKVGLVQLLYVALSTTIVTHGLKHFLDDCWVMHTRLGQRPNGGSINMPSGHSSMASCAVYFIGRRYSPWLGLLLSIIVALTMYARVMLNAHTISAVIAGALVGCLTTALFTSPRRASHEKRQQDGTRTKKAPSRTGLGGV
jgi:lipid A 1-phosphatase